MMIASIASLKLQGMMVRAYAKHLAKQLDKKQFQLDDLSTTPKPEERRGGLKGGENQVRDMRSEARKQAENLRLGQLQLEVDRLKEKYAKWDLRAADTQGRAWWYMLFGQIEGFVLAAVINYYFPLVQLAQHYEAAKENVSAFLNKFNGG